MNTSTLNKVSTSIGRSIEVLTNWKVEHEWDTFQKLYGSDDILPTVKFEQWHTIQWQNVIELLVVRWKITGEVLHEVERRVIWEDWQEEVETLFKTTYPPPFLKTYETSLKGEANGDT